MPDIALLHGRMMVIAWDSELEGGIKKHFQMEANLFQIF